MCIKINLSSSLSSYEQEKKKLSEHYGTMELGNESDPFAQTVHEHLWIGNIISLDSPFCNKINDELIDSMEERKKKYISLEK